MLKGKRVRLFYFAAASESLENNPGRCEEEPKLVTRSKVYVYYYEFKVIYLMLLVGLDP
jgi:hypothetical protein